MTKGKIRKKVMRQVSLLVGKLTGSLSQEERERVAAEGELSAELPPLARRCAAEGAVLLENTGVLPLRKGANVAVFGRVQVDYFTVGYGSGGDVNAPYRVNLLQGLRENPDVTPDEILASQYEAWCKANPADHGYWGHWPRFHPEMPLSDADVASAANRSDAALVVIGRAAGEDRENVLQPGSFFLTPEELRMLDQVTVHFEEVVVLLNCGSIIDMAWTQRYAGKLGAILYVWQGGMESGHAVADLLTGAVTPSGRLTDTIAQSYEDYPSASNFGNEAYNNYAEDIYVGYRYFETFAPERVLYPFGYGLGYTTFSMDVEDFASDAKGIRLCVKVTNAGKQYTGREVVQVYHGAPQGALGKPERTLLAFAKTKELLPGDSERLTITCPVSAMASFDDAGATGHGFCYVLEAGEYPIFVGSNVRDAAEAGVYLQEHLQVTETLQEVMPLPKEHVFRRMQPGELTGGKREVLFAPVPAGRSFVRERILEHLPPAVKTRAGSCTLQDVTAGKAALDDFVAQLSLEELEAISRGAYVMNSPLGTPGNAGVLGGVLPSLRKKGVVPITTSDGPSGIRLWTGASLLPCGTALACSWDVDLVQALYVELGREMVMKGSDVLLAPGMNIHRDPLCGRNFEYFSEDPLVTGKMATAVVRGIQSQGVAACPKHFACNNQETKRNKNDSRVSQRALREIYLRGFAICVREGKPDHIMTSYNKINGVWSHYNYDLCTTVLRGEWGYEGNVMTDWWMQKSQDPNFPRLRDNAYRVRAQVDVLMPGGKQVGKNKKPNKTLLESYGKPDGITLGEMQRGAKNVLKYVLHSSAFCRQYGMTYRYAAPEEVYFWVERVSG